MRFYVGVTDNAWFNFLSERQPDEVNFWQPRGGQAFLALSPGELFLFKLHAPLNFIVGGGWFVSHSILPLSLAWEAFASNNGASEFMAFRKRVLKYQHADARELPDPMIGCIILSQPFFWVRDEWIPAPENWRPNIVRGRTYDTKERIGAKLWEQVQERLSRQLFFSRLKYVAVAEEKPRYGAEYLTKARLGQGAFRVLVTDAYNRRCAMTGERTLPVLDSAHIKPYAMSGPNTVNNGLLLRSDLHKLFDIGYVTITDDLHIEVSKKIKEEYENGREYYALHGKSLISLPNDPIYQPSREYIDWHNHNIFLS